MPLSLNIELEVEVDGEYYPGSPMIQNAEFPNCLPGDPPDITNLKVFVLKNGRKSEITSLLSREKLEEIKSQALEAGEAS